MAFALLLFDLLLTFLILFPLVAGGFWIKRPGLNLELAQLGIPVLIVTAAALFLKFALQAPIEESFVSRQLRRLWQSWRSAVEARPTRTLWLAALAFGSLCALASLRRHWALASGANDLAIFGNMLWNLTHGFGYQSSMKGWTNLFLDHQSPILLVIAPIYALFPQPETLLIIQALGLAAGGVAAHRLMAQTLASRGMRSHWGLAAVPLLYWAYLPTRNANAFDFHPEVLMLPIFLWALNWLQTSGSRAKLLGILLLFFGLMGKESGGVVLSGLGLAWFFNRSRMLGLGLIIAGAALFVFQIKLVPKLFFEAEYVYNAAYRSFGGGLTDILLSPFLNPGVFWSHLFGPARIRFLFWTLGGLGFIPLLNWRTAIAALPCYLMVFMTDGDHRLNLFYYYATEASIGLFWALPGGLLIAEQKLRERKPDSGSGFGPAGVCLGIWLAFWALALFDRSEAYRIRVHSPSDQAHWLRTELLPCVEGSEIAAVSGLVPHLTARPWVSDLPRIRVPGPGKQPVSSEDSDFVRCIISDPTTRAWPLSDGDVEALVQQLPALGYREVFACKTTRVWERTRSQGSLRPWEHQDGRRGSVDPACLRCTPSCPPLRPTS